MIDRDFSDCEMHDDPLCFDCHALGRPEEWNEKSAGIAKSATVSGRLSNETDRQRKGLSGLWQKVCCAFCNQEVQQVPIRTHKKEERGIRNKMSRDQIRKDKGRPKAGQTSKAQNLQRLRKKFIGHFNTHRCKDCQKKAEKQQKEKYAKSERGKELTAKRLAKMAEVYNLNKQKKISPKFALTPEEKQKRIEAQKQKAKEKYQELKADPVKWRKAQERVKENGRERIKKD